MLFFFRAESAHSIRGPDARHGHDPAPETPARGRIRAPYPTVLRSVIPSFSSLLLSVLGCMPALSAAPPAQAQSRSTAPTSPSRTPLEDRRGRSRRRHRPRGRQAPRGHPQARHGLHRQGAVRQGRPNLHRRHPRRRRPPQELQVLRRTLRRISDRIPRRSQVRGAVSQCLLTRRLPGGFLVFSLFFPKDGSPASFFMKRIFSSFWSGFPEVCVSGRRSFFHVPVPSSTPSRPPSSFASSSALGYI